MRWFITHQWVTGGEERLVERTPEQRVEKQIAGWGGLPREEVHLAKPEKAKAEWA